MNTKIPANKLGLTTKLTVTLALLSVLLGCARSAKSNSTIRTQPQNPPVKGNKMTSHTLTISALQMLVTDDVAANEKRILAAIKKAADQHADFLITPEGSLSGYSPGFDREKVAAAVERLAADAKKAKLGLLLATCYKQIEDKKEYYYNQVRAYTPQGEYLGCYNKILRCSPLDHPGSGEMLDYVEGKPRTFDYKGIRFGILICNDLWATPGYTTMPNPYLAWKLKQMGAQLIFHPINYGTNQKYRTFHESSAELWAKALDIHILEVNAVANPKDKVNARSGLIGPDGNRLLAVPDTGEQFFTCKINF